MNNDLKQNDIIVKKSKVAKIAEEEINSEKNIPIGFFPVKFCTKDIFGPSILHFRNYSLAELLEIASTSDDNKAYTVVKTLKNMCFENYDCTKLSVENIKEIMLTLYLNFWGTKLISRPYYKDDTLENLDNKDNVAYVDIPIKDIHIIDIPDNFKSHFTIILGKEKVKFCLPVIEHSFIAEKFVKNFYVEDEQKFREIKTKLQFIEKLELDNKFEEASKVSINSSEKEDYDNFVKNRELLYLKVMQSELIESINDKPIDTLEEKLKAFDNGLVSIDFWTAYNETVENNKFGVDDSYTFKVDGKQITRRFSFRLVDLLPAVDKGRTPKYTVQFDD